jgi:hypothetical protein
MRTSEPPRLAVALLRRFLPGNEPLAGDLLEGFAARQSRLWFWREVLVAIAMRPGQYRDEEHPLGLAGYSPEPRRRIEPVRTINLTASPLPGIGGLSLIVFGTLITVVEPRLWWIFVPVVLGGVALGAAMVMIRRHGQPQRPDRFAP